MKKILISLFIFTACDVNFGTKTKESSKPEQCEQRPLCGYCLCNSVMNSGGNEVWFDDWKKCPKYTGLDCYFPIPDTNLDDNISLMQYYAPCVFNPLECRGICEEE